MNKKILVLDIDGTLVTSTKDISPETKKKLIEIQEMGHIVMLASGRPSPGMLRYAKELEFEKFGGYILSYNGACIINCKTGEIVHEEILPGEVIPQLYDFAMEHGCGLVTYRDGVVLSATDMDEFIEIETRINTMPFKKIDNFVEYVDFNVYKCLMTAPPEEAEKHVTLLQERFSDQLTIFRSEPFFIEIMPKDIDKSTSLTHMLERIGMKREDAICCGDGYNDLTMISYAGVGVAMGNARDEVKAVADYITKTNDEDGLVEVIEKFIL